MPPPKNPMKADGSPNAPAVSPLAKADRMVCRGLKRQTLLVSELFPSTAPVVPEIVHGSMRMDCPADGGVSVMRFPYRRMSGLQGPRGWPGANSGFPPIALTQQQRHCGKWSPRRPPFVRDLRVGRLPRRPQGCASPGRRPNCQRASLLSG
jgi:hypothetical protein